MQVGRRIHLALRHETARPNGGFKGRRRFREPTPPLKTPVGPSSVMPQSEVNAPAHLQDGKIKENLDYTVIKIIDI